MSWFSRAISRISPWEIVTSESMAINIGELLMGGATLAALYVSKNAANVTVTPFGMSGDVTRLRFLGAGVGIGVGVPIDVSLSSVDMPSGGLVYCGELTPEGKQVQLSDLTGPCMIQVYGAALMAGVSATIVFFGNSSGLPMASRAIGITQGVGLETPGAGAMEYRGYLWQS
jgi:hypothetical protein